MPKYIWTAKDSSGKSVVKEISHDTVEGAKALLLAEGCTDLKLMQDDIAAVATEGTEKARFLGEELKVTAEDRVKAMKKPPPTVLGVLWEGFAQSKWLIVVIGALAAYEAYRGSIAVAALFLLGLLAWLVFILYVGLPGIYYRKLVIAADWNRHHEVLDLVARLKKLRRIHFIKVPLHDLARFRAGALAGLGDLAAALDEFRPYENQPGCPSWLYKALVAGFYDAVKDYDKGLEWAREAIQEQPNSALYLDLANRLLRYKRDAASARAALAEAQKNTISELSKPYFLRCRGILAFLEGDYVNAKLELEAAVKLILSTPHRVGRDGHSSVARGYLCCVLARLGETAEAQRCFEQAKEYLVATGEDELLAQCQSYLGTSQRR